MEGADRLNESIPESHVGYRVAIVPSPKRIRGVCRGETLADSSRVLVMHETRLPPAFYFPRDDVRTDLLESTDHRTNCPFKGNASYWSIKVGDELVENAAWSYEDPFDEASSLKDYVAFNWSAMDVWFADETEIVEQPRDERPAKANPFIEWLVHEAWKARSPQDLVERLAQALLANGFPLWRLRLLVRTMNPQLFSNSYTWQQGVAEITEFQVSHAEIQSPRYLNSPFALIINGEGGVRRRLEGSNPQLDFPILEDLINEGATDYVAMPLRFSDGQINIIALVSDQPEGFSTEQLGQLYEALPNLGRLLEAHAQRTSSLTLLRTYLGEDAGQRVMKGLIKRGDGTDLHAVVWLSDLRDSTGLAESLSRERYLATLNHYFDAVAGAVIEHGGEVLKFIGDAVLAIFPIEDRSEARPEACERALKAARDAQRRLEAVNREREAWGEPALAFGVGLHRGDLTYGNIGTERRLDFTVIGPAVNEASRIESLSKTLGQPVVISSIFAASCPEKLKSLGEHSLRGVTESQEIFTLSPEGAVKHERPSRTGSALGEAD